MRKSIGQLKFEEASHALDMAYARIRVLEAENKSISNGANEMALIIAKEASTTKEWQEKYEQAYQTINKLLFENNKFDAKVKHLLSTVYSLARAADPDPKDPLAPTY